MRSLQSLEDSYRQKRYDRYDSGNMNIRHLLGHRVANRIMVMLIKVQRLIKRQKLIIINDRHRITDRPTIFAPTHIGGVDAEMVFEAVQKPAWFMVADSREMYRSFSGAMLDFNGAICFDSDHKKDRFIAKERVKELMRKGQNVIAFPEGAYNISPNQLVMHLYTGTAEIAISTGADIVPIALVRDGRNYYVNIGKIIDARKYSLEQKHELTELLREALASMVWEILEQLPVTKRGDIASDYYENVFLEEMFADNGNYTYTVEDVRNTMFRPKSITEPDEVYSFMHKLQPKKENAFLLRNST
ncbi:lysophospholipid acyltransferase family protein [Butyrivibrio proteoclasticus]|uniref:lysophospholipid acyltransferase family protein n=1 Tax=Butyrivibrio proteoclasticus TaxID=43305 RepID=UPI00047B3A56|nr:lysophospholipid acyltransferase family protein [Butyrivibrio proteoclasticus]